MEALATQGPVPHLFKRSARVLIPLSELRTRITAAQYRTILRECHRPENRDHVEIRHGRMFASKLLLKSLLAEQVGRAGIFLCLLWNNCTEVEQMVQNYTIEVGKRSDNSFWKDRFSSGQINFQKARETLHSAQDFLNLGPRFLAFQEIGQLLKQSATGTDITKRFSECVEQCRITVDEYVEKKLSERREVTSLQGENVNWERFYVRLLDAYVSGERLTDRLVRSLRTESINKSKKEFSSEFIETYEDHGANFVSGLEEEQNLQQLLEIAFVGEDDVSKQIFSLHVFDGMGFKEIADAYGKEFGIRTNAGINARYKALLKRLRLKRVEFESAGFSTRF